MNGEIQNSLSNWESWSTIVRNYGLVIAAVIALPLAIWRSFVATRQAETAQRSLLNERYQKGAEMLGSEGLSVRLGGIYALWRLAEEYPEEYYILTMHLFCAFVRDPTRKAVEAGLIDGGLFTSDAEFTSGEEEADEEDGIARPPRVRDDVQAIIDLIRKRSEKHITVEREADFRLDLRAAKLRFASLASMSLARTLLVKADLSNAILNGTILSGANLYNAVLSGANLEDVNLRGAILKGADLSEANLKNCKGLTREQLDGAVAPDAPPPNLTGVVDVNTGEPLVWRVASPSG